MSKWRDKIKNLLLCIMMLAQVGVFAQLDRLDRAESLYQAKDADRAALVIDSVVHNAVTKGSYQAWTLRAYIYFEKYKRADRAKLNSNLRDSVVSSVKKSMNLKPDSNYIAQNKKIITTIASGYYNLAKTLLQDSLNDAKSLKAYNKFKEVFSLGDPTFNFTVKDIEYYLAVGSIFSDLFINDMTNLKAQKVAKTSLNKVLELQPDNTSGNLNMGLMYFNQAVKLVQNMTYDTPIDQAEIIQENTIKLARQGEVYILKVYKIDPKNKKAVEALYLTYRILSDAVKREEFRKKCLDLGIDIIAD
jgi:tetratricopeptide (TPR) repeat protein